MLLYFAGKVGGFCMMCELQRHVRRAVENNGAIRPAAILQKLKSKNDSPGVALYRGHFVTSAIYV